MKKILPLILLAILLVGVSSCTNKGTAKTYETTSLLGTWEASWITTLDMNKKVIEENDPKDEYGCGQMTWTFTKGGLNVMTYIGKDDNGNCIERNSSMQYTLQGDQLQTIDEDGVEEKMSVMNLTEDELVIMTELEKPMEYNGYKFKYVKLGCKRVK